MEKIIAIIQWTFSISSLLFLLLFILGITAHFYKSKKMVSRRTMVLFTI